MFKHTPHEASNKLQVEKQRKKSILRFVTPGVPINSKEQQLKLPEDGLPKKRTLTIHQAIDYVMMAIDTRMRKVIFPEKAWLTNVVRPIFPDYVDTRLIHVAKL